MKTGNEFFYQRPYQVNVGKRRLPDLSRNGRLGRSCVKPRCLPRYRLNLYLWSMPDCPQCTQLLCVGFIKRSNSHLVEPYGMHCINQFLHCFDCSITRGGYDYRFRFPGYSFVDAAINASESLAAQI